MRMAVTVPFGPYEHFFFYVNPTFKKKKKKRKKSNTNIQIVD